MSGILWEFRQPGFEAVNQTFETLNDGAIAGPATAHSFVLEDDDKQLVFDGDFSIDGAGNITGGTITGFHLYDGETLGLDVSGYEIDVTEFLASLGSPGGGVPLPIEFLLDGPMTVDGTAGMDLFYGGRFADRMIGHGGMDGFHGNDGRDVLLGGSGRDQLFGGNGKDLLKGGAGADHLFGGRGTDELKGGGGYDTFHFDLPPNAGGVDKIDDFKVGQDTLALSVNAFDKVGGLGVLNVAKFYTGAHAHDGSDRVIYNDETGALYYDADGKGGDAQVKFAKLHAGLHLSNADFLVV